MVSIPLTGLSAGAEAGSFRTQVSGNIAGVSAKAEVGSVSVVAEGTPLILRIGDVVDLGKEKARLGKEIDRLDADLARFAAKLGNPGFLAKAKPEVIEEQREREADTRRDRDRLKAAYERLGTA